MLKSKMSIKGNKVLSSVLMVTICCGVLAACIAIPVTQCRGHDEPLPPPKPDPINPTTLELTAETQHPNLSNNGVLTNNIISFNTYDNCVLHVFLKYATNNINLKWKFKDDRHDNIDWKDIDQIVQYTGLTIDYSDLGEISFSSDDSQSRDNYYSDSFSLEAVLDDTSLPPQPINVVFNNAPDVGRNKIIDVINTTIVGFNLSNTNGGYDTIFIPSEITSINDRVFNEFNGGSYRIVFADRLGALNIGSDNFSCVTGHNDFSGFMTFNEIYIGLGRYWNVSEGDIYFFTARCEDYYGDAIHIRKDLIIIGDIDLSSNSGNCYFMCTYISQGRNAQSTIQIDGDVIIKGHQKIVTNTTDGSVYFFRAYSNYAMFEHDVNEAMIRISGRLVIDGICDFRGKSIHFFESDPGTGGCDAMDIGDVTISNSSLSMKSSEDYSKFFFFALYDTGQLNELKSLTIANSHFYISSGLQPNHITCHSVATWPTWEII